MKTFIIQEKFVGYADIHIDAETEEERLPYIIEDIIQDSNYHIDDMFYNYEFDSISEWTDSEVQNDTF